MALPYIYLPNLDFEHFIIEMESFDASIVCHYGDNYCKYMVSCQNLTADTWFLEFELMDESTSNQYGLPSNNRFMIPGQVMGDSEDTCYLPVFRSISGAQDQWYVGSLFLQYFYLVFDMTPYDEEGEDYI